MLFGLRQGYNTSILQQHMNLSQLTQNVYFVYLRSFGYIFL